MANQSTGSGKLRQPFYVYLSNLFHSSLPKFPQKYGLKECLSKFVTNVTRLGNLLEFGQLFKAFGNN